MNSSNIQQYVLLKNYPKNLQSNGWKKTTLLGKKSQPLKKSSFHQFTALFKLLIEKIILKKQKL